MIDVTGMPELSTPHIGLSHSLQDWVALVKDMGSLYLALGIARV
jgi:hypothetical protein